jgi:hypothetical protein
MNRRRFLAASVAGVAGALVHGSPAAAAAAAAAGVPPLRITRLVRAWPTRRRIRVVHLTDVHVGWTTPFSVLVEAQRVAAALKPDLVVLTGDYVNGSLHHAASLALFVRGLPRPCVATLGNHDHWSGADGVAATLAAEGARVLANGSVEVAGAGWRLPVVGVDDGVTRRDDVERAFHRVQAPRDALVLSHSPATVVPIAAHGGRLVLSGHTHGGQVRVPILTPAVSALVGQPWLAGQYEVAGATLYVNAGIGHSRPGLRIGDAAAAEVVVVDLVPPTDAPDAMRCGRPGPAG